MNVDQVLRLALKTVEAAGVPDDLRVTAYREAIQMFRAEDAESIDAESLVARRPAHSAKASSVNHTNKRSAPASAGDDGSPLCNVGDESAFFGAVSRETEVAIQYLGDVFHVEGGVVELKVSSKDLGANSAESTKTVAALLAGSVFAGTKYRKLPIVAVHEVCKAKHCFSDKHASEYVKATPGFAVTGQGRDLALTSKSGWQTEFAKAVARVLRREVVTA